MEDYTDMEIEREEDARSEYSKKSKVFRCSDRTCGGLDCASCYGENEAREYIAEQSAETEELKGVCCSTELDDTDVLEAMQLYGGGFVKALAEAATRADSDNLQRIKKAWPEYWEKYAQMALASNDPKLSDRRSGRGSCAVGLRGAGAVTAEPVRCSAWLGDVGLSVMSGEVEGTG